MDEPHQAIDESRWQQLTQLLCQLFKASACTVLQYQVDEAKLLTVKQSKNVGLHRGAVEKIDTLKARLANPTLPTEDIWRQGLIEFPLYWPGGIGFGAVLMVCDRRPPNLESCQTLAAPILDLLQAELKVYRQAKQMERLSLQDESTQMLNTHGFNLMAPRQLNLSRRLGSHAGLVVMKNGTQYQGEEAEERLRALSQVVYDNLREADLAARIDDQIVLLAFVDSEANLDSLVTRLRKQFARKLEPQRVLTGHSFFTPDSHLGLGPMMDQALEELEITRARLYPKPSVSRTDEFETDMGAAQFTASVTDDTDATHRDSAHSDSPSAEPWGSGYSASPSSDEEPGISAPPDAQISEPALEQSRAAVPSEACEPESDITAEPDRPTDEPDSVALDAEPVVQHTETVDTMLEAGELTPSTKEDEMEPGAFAATVSEQVAISEPEQMSVSEPTTDSENQFDSAENVAASAEAVAPEEAVKTNADTAQEAQVETKKTPRRSSRGTTTIKLTATKKAKTTADSPKADTDTKAEAANAAATEVTAPESTATDATTAEAGKAKGAASKRSAGKSTATKGTGTKSATRSKKTTTSSKSSSGTGSRRRKAATPPEE